MIKLKYIIAVILVIAIVSPCLGNEAVIEVDSFTLAGEKVVAGNQFHLTPLKDEMINLKGEGFSINEFDFHCILQSKEKEIDSFKDVIAIDLSTKKITKTLKFCGSEFIKWPSSTTEKKITMSFPILPGEVYSGEGFFYFYLDNKKDECISNIVGRKVKFE